MHLPKLRLAGLALALLPCALRLSAQQPPPPITLGEIYRAVDSASPSLRAAGAFARAAAARVPASRRWPDPQLQLQLMNRNLPRFGLNDPLGMNQIQVMQMIPVPGKLSRAGSAAEARADAGRLQVAEVAWTQRADAAMAFFELHRLDATLEVSRETLRLLVNVDSTATQMYALGQAQQSDVLRAQLEISQMTADIEEMIGMRSAMAARLNAVLDRSAGSLVGPTVLPTLPDTLVPADSLVTRALASRGMLRAGAASIRAATESERLAQKEIWPDLLVGVVYGQRPMADGSTDRMMSLMLGATIPVWAGSRQFRMRDEATAMREMAEAELGAMQAQTRGRVMELVARFDRSRRLRALYARSILPQAQATERAAYSGYQAGTVNFMTLLDALMAANSYREKLQQLDADTGTALAELEMLTGAPLIPGNPPASGASNGGTR
ncbi:MAG: TolC family protein [Gemmatimonadales bacterium]